MEQIAPIFENPTADGFFGFQQSEQILRDSEIVSIQSKLLATLDIHALAIICHDLVKQRLPVTAVQFFWQGQRVSSLNELHSSKAIKLSIDDMDANIGYQIERKLGSYERKLLEELHSFINPAAANAIRHEQLKQLATKDHLTGLDNRASFDKTLNRLVSLSQRNHTTFGLIVMDLDKFKPINDEYGHSEGDKILIAAAEVIQNSLRNSDYAFRFGGDEFCCLLENADDNVMFRVTHRIRTAFAQHPLLAKHQVGCSMGCANYQQNEEPGVLFDRADSRLYENKQASRLHSKTA